MSFQTPITIKQALSRIQSQEYVLPAIQREFVWKPDQICNLFDSLMQGYPIGSFLLWQVEEKYSQEYVYYGFLKDFHEWKHRHCPKLDLPHRKVSVVLDGQQRLTSLNIGIRGSYAEKLPKKWANNLDAYPVKKLYLNVCAPAPENEAGRLHDFKFLVPESAKSDITQDIYWFPVSEIWDCDNPGKAFKLLQKANLGNHERASETLMDLWHLVHSKEILPYFQETDQNLDKVLKIFIRVNSAGTPLSYSDLLLSIATAQWQELDARDAVHGLVDELNEIGNGFQISKDLVLKAGLLLSDIPSVAFRVTNFNLANMAKLEQKWEEISQALRLAVRLVSSFGFSRQNLAADSAILPIAYYLRYRGLSDTYLTSVGCREDRAAVRAWLCRSLVKSGIWGSALDTTLLAIRTALQEAGGTEFPAAAIEDAMARRGKSLRFTEEELADLLETPYAHKRCFALLSLLYPGADLGSAHHVDHLFPQTLFTAPKLRRLGFEREVIEDLQDRCGRLPNLHLLTGSENQSKQDMLPAIWLEQRFPEAAARASYAAAHDLEKVPQGLDGFAEFYGWRRERLADRTRKILGLSPASFPTGGEPEQALDLSGSSSG